MFSSSPRQMEHMGSGDEQPRPEAILADDRLLFFLAVGGESSDLEVNSEAGGGVAEVGSLSGVGGHA
jgi:hypothetical protein